MDRINKATQSKSRILFILHLPPPVHGASMVGNIMKESTNLNSQFECDFINLSASKNLSEIGKFRLSKVFSYLSLYIKVLNSLVFKKIDLYYLTINTKGSPFYKDLGIVLLIKIFRKKLVYHFHNKGVSEYQDRKFDNLLYKFTFRGAKVILLSPLLYYDIEKYISKENVYFCPNGIMPISPKKSSKTDGEPCRLLFISNMMKEKGVLDLIQACEILKNKGLNFVCDFVGKWHNIDEQTFRQTVQNAHLKNYVFAHGAKYGEEKLFFYTQADVFILPSHNEAYPLVLLEAMQHKLPTVSSEIGAIPEIVGHNKTGLIFEAQNSFELASKIEQLILSPSMRKEFGCNGYQKFMEKFTLEKFEMKIEQIFNIILSKG